jgi:hypothetical protein
MALHGAPVDDATVRDLVQGLRVVYLNYRHEEVEVLELVVCGHEPSSPRPLEESIAEAITLLNAGQRCPPDP